MTDSPLDPDSAHAYIRDWQERVDRVAAGAQAMSDRVKQLRVTAGDDNDLTEVTIDATGALTGIRFTERIHRTPPDAVARAVMSAVRAARRAAAEQSRQIVTEALGNESTAARTIADRMEQQLLGEATDD